MDQQPWYEKKKLDPVFPFILWETSMRGFTLHWHQLLELVSVRSGSLVISVEGKAHEAAAGDIFIINSGFIHGYSRSASDTSIILIQFSLELFDQSLMDLRDQMLQNLVFGRKIRLTREEDGDVHHRLEQLVLTLQKEYSVKGEGYRLAIKARLYDLALILLRDIPAKTMTAGEKVRRQLRNEVLERILPYVHANFFRPITLDQAADAANLSKFYFSRFFKEQTGQSFHGYLSRVRVSHAEELLSSTNLPVTEISYRSGFSSLKTFNRLFRTFTGTSPTRYRDGA